jgi:23S rRNA (cytosine1962-C5)-methyltransferase
MAETPFHNRLRKNFRHLRKWAQRNDLTAFRIYDRDIPEYPYVVEWYDGRIHLVEYPRRKSVRDGSLETLREEALEAVRTVLEIPRERIFTKTHQPMPWGQKQYERVDKGGEHFTVREQGLTFWVNLSDHLDTGLFLDHRNTRARVRSEAKGKRCLNLFAYTGSFTVYAAAGGASHTTTVDLSNTYLDWALENLKVNRLDGDAHVLERANALEWLEAAGGRKDRYDLIVLDPPSFSTSKRMKGTLDIQRDHPRLLALTLGLLKPGGVLYFSTNFTRFTLDEGSVGPVRHEELTPRSLPEDFSDTSIHRCWRFVRD